MLTVSIGSVTDVSCYGGSDGSATATPSGGTSPYTYQWPGGRNSAVVSDFAAGVYEVTVTDSKGCTATASVTITEPSVLTVSIGSVTDVSCNGGSDGSATATPTGGTSPYSYAWPGSRTTAVVSDFAAGMYEVTVTDANGCTATASITISQPAPLAVTSAPVNSTATGTCIDASSVSTQFDTWKNGFTYTGGANPVLTVSYIVTANVNNTTEVDTFTTSTPPPADGGFTTVVWTLTDICGTPVTTTRTFTVNNCIRVSGSILRDRDGSPVSGATVVFSGSNKNDGSSNSSGAYSVWSITAGETRTVTPSKTLFSAPYPKTQAQLNAENINVYDVQAIQAHVGSGTQFSSVWQRVAANVVLGSSGSQTNNRLTSTDATVLSQAINGNSTQQQRLVWRIIPSDFNLLAGAPSPLPRSWGLVPTSSAGNQAPSQYGSYVMNKTHNTLNMAMKNQNFTAVKVGDVVPNPSSFGDGGAGVRYAGTPLVWRVKDVNLREGETVDAVFSAEQMTNLAGWQFGMQFDPEYLQVESLTTTAAMPELDPEVNFGLYQVDKGEIRSLWADAGAKSLSRGASVFSIRFKVLKGGRQLSSLLHLDNEVLESFAISANLDPVSVVLRFDDISLPTDGKGEPVLYQNTPNPFNKDTYVRFELPESADIQLSIHDINGRLIKEYNGFYDAGIHEVRFNRGELSNYAGVLYYTLRCGEYTVTRRMVIMD